MDGSIKKRGEMTYRLIVSIGKNLDDSKSRKIKTFHGSRKDVEIALAEFVTEINCGLVSECKQLTIENSATKKCSTVFHIDFNIKIV